MIAKMSSFQGVEGSSLRWIGVGLVALGLFVAYSRFPTRPTDNWLAIKSFELDGEECEALRGQRLTTELTVVAEDEVLPTYSDVADNFNLELALVCQANGQAGDCGAMTAPAEEKLILPLYRDPAFYRDPALASEPASTPAEAP